MSNKFANALKSKASPQTKAPPAVGKKQADNTPHSRSASRANTKHIGGYFDPTVAKQLKTIAVDEETSVQDLLAEAIDLLFQARNKPMIARKGL